MLELPADLNALRVETIERLKQYQRILKQVWGQTTRSVNHSTVP